MKIAAAAIMYESPVWKFFIDGLEFCDEIYLKVDMSKSSEAFLTTLAKNPKIKSVEKFDNFKYIVYKEIVLRMLDKVKPDLAVLLDHDEVFDKGIVYEIAQFVASDKLGMMFNYNPCISQTGKQLPIYPSLPHMKVFKWREGLSFVPYKSQDRVTQYVKEQVQWFAKTKVNHYCMYTEEMEKAKIAEVMRLYRKF